MTRRAVVVVDLGFGDAGKGVVTDWLSRALPVHTVVRFNGGAQAGHNVTTPDGRHHTFSQLGSASFVDGVRTVLSRHVVVHPTALLVEAARLAESGVRDPLSRIWIAEDALVTTPFHQAANRLRELARGEGARHGSCGVGVGETVSDAERGDAIRIRDLADIGALRAALLRAQERMRADLAFARGALSDVVAAQSELAVLDDARVVDAWIEAVAPLRARDLARDDARIAREINAPGAVVFEGAQGVLLDEWVGFHPHTTWSTCTFENAHAILEAAAFEGRIDRIGVVRTYAHRHGQGPLPTATPELCAALAEPDNATGPWQGAFRIGFPDLVLSRYALAAVGGVDALALTHLDACERLSTWRVATSYGAPRDEVEGVVRDPSGDVVAILPPKQHDLERQARIGELLQRAVPRLVPLDLGATAPRDRYVAHVERALDVRVALRFAGPRANDAACASWF